MSNYTKATNFAGKDALSSGDPQKIIKGSEIDAEYNAIASAITSKADLNGPTFTGTPSGPTASTGTASTQFATTAFVQSALVGAYPVGSIYMNATVATNPATLLGFGTWTAFGAGKVPVGIDTGDTDFDTIGETGGTKDASLFLRTITLLIVSEVGEFIVYRFRTQRTVFRQEVLVLQGSGGDGGTSTIRLLVALEAMFSWRYINCSKQCSYSGSPG